MQYSVFYTLYTDVLGCVLTLSMIRHHFDKDGVSIDPKYHLPTGNCEKNGLREYSWPQSRLRYGPGIVLVCTVYLLVWVCLHVFTLALFSFFYCLIL